ncbi:hypothetical protein, partial [Actinotalea sp. JY-7885]|uniref:hypothetical protein n=1 Tax=Actinotalea sp. JY-7885 TaxID=2758576 RepID=UPI001CB7222E
VLDAIFGYDPFKEAQKSFAGDWNAMYAAGSASQNLGQYMTLVWPRSPRPAAGGRCPRGTPWAWPRVMS